MINLFQIPAGDQSMYYLGQVFGYVGNVLSGTGSSTMLVGVMFKVLNTMALTIGAFVIVYITIVGMLATAHEGEFLGKKWSGLWVPIRTTLGIAALFPLPSGYSAIQIVAMWIILQGVGAADLLWTSVLKYIDVTGSPYATVSGTSGGNVGLNIQMETLFKAQVCQANAKANNPPIDLTKTRIRYFCDDNPTQEFCRTDSAAWMKSELGKKDTTSVPIGPDGKCGTLNLSCNEQEVCPGGGKDNTLECRSCQAQKNALKTIVETFDGIGSEITKTDYQYMSFRYPPNLMGIVFPGLPATGWIKSYCEKKNEDKCTYQSVAFKSLTGIADATHDVANVDETTLKNLYYPFSLKKVLGDKVNFIDDAVKYYNGTMTAAVTEFMTQQSPEISNQTLKEAQEYGWILAGRYYFTLARMNQNNQKTTGEIFTMDAPAKYPKGDLAPCDPENKQCSRYRINYLSMDSLFSITTRSGGAGNAIDPAIDRAVGDTSAKILNAFINCLSDNNRSPIVAIAGFGYQLMIAAQALFVAIAYIVGGVLGVTAINIVAIGTGLTTSPLSEAIKGMVSIFTPLLFALVLALFTLGGLLGIYVPLIPFIVFSMGAIGWLIATIEAMVAAPIVALGVLGPGGQHEILGRAEPALMLIFNVFLRPSLMIFGLMTAMLLSIVVIQFINKGFLAIQQDIISSPGLFEQLLFISAYTTILITAINKVFSLIHVIPERVLTWIGGQAVQYGEAEATGALKHGVEAGAGAAAGAQKESAGGVSGAASGLGQAIGYEAKHKADQQKPAPSDAQVSGAPPATPAASGESKPAKDDKGT